MALACIAADLKSMPFSAASTMIANRDHSSTALPNLNDVRIGCVAPVAALAAMVSPNAFSAARVRRSPFWAFLIVSMFVEAPRAAAGESMYPRKLLVPIRPRLIASIAIA